MCGEHGGEVMFGANSIEGTHNSITNHHQMERFSTVMIPVSVFQSTVLLAGCVQVVGHNLRNDASTAGN